MKFGQYTKTSECLGRRETQVPLADEIVALSLTESLKRKREWCKVTKTSPNSFRRLTLKPWSSRENKTWCHIHAGQHRHRRHPKLYEGKWLCGKLGNSTEELQSNSAARHKSSRGPDYHIVFGTMSKKETSVASTYRRSVICKLHDCLFPHTWVPCAGIVSYHSTSSDRLQKASKSNYIQFVAEMTIHNFLGQKLWPLFLCDSWRLKQNGQCKNRQHPSQHINT